MKSFHNELTEYFYNAVLKLRNAEECRNFFEDVCTIKELQDMAQRMDAAILLDEGVNYQTISEQVGISTATISRVSKCLNYGSGGYRAALDRLKEGENK